MSTCGKCFFGRPVPGDLMQRFCFGAPPTALPIMGPNGQPKGQIITRPTMHVNEPMCAAFKPRGEFFLITVGGEDKVLIDELMKQWGFDHPNDVFKKAFSIAKRHSEESQQA